MSERESPKSAPKKRSQQNKLAEHESMAQWITSDQNTHTKKVSVWISSPSLYPIFSFSIPNLAFTFSSFLKRIYVAFKVKFIRSTDVLIWANGFKYLYYHIGNPLISLIFFTAARDNRKACIFHWFSKASIRSTAKIAGTAAPCLLTFSDTPSLPDWPKWPCTLELKNKKRSVG